MATSRKLKKKNPIPREIYPNFPDRPQFLTGPADVSRGKMKAAQGQAVPDGRQGEHLESIHEPQVSFDVSTKRVYTQPILS
ncbi:MAG: hypothetical protein HYY21_00040 [Candidatus Tectomicrobia bacterium]|nr:hypothetical protein [Candidatus Tectomicrobia bacterium]